MIALLCVLLFLFGVFLGVYIHALGSIIFPQHNRPRFGRRDQ